MSSKPAPPPVAPKPNSALLRSRSQSDQVSTTHISTASKEPPSNNVSGLSDRDNELQQLTNKLLYNMNQALAGDSFVGVCNRCDGIIKGTEDACTAMDKYYHSACFVCHVCGRSLSGHSFYAVDDKAHCEGCYVNTLEKCYSCKQPVTERILRATGKAFHPECFICTHCKKNLDGVPFTVDAHNKIHCIEDFHQKYAPRCNICKLPILPEGNGVETVRIVALDKNFHVKCYKCEDCHALMSTDSSNSGCFPLNGRLLCKKCNLLKLQSLTQSGTASPIAVSDM